jgi:RNA polymerase sigma-70 factor (ECF subfamily)
LVTLYSRIVRWGIERLANRPRANWVARQYTVLGTSMPPRDDSKTSSTLLGRLALVPPDQAAWGEFVDRYGPRIVKWCRKWRLQDADVLDVSQAVLARLAKRLRQFEYDPLLSFRGLLRKLVHDALKDALAARGRIVAGGGSEVWEMLESTVAREDLIQRLEEEFDLELLEAASRLVRQRVAPHTWEAYRLTTDEGLSGAEAAARLGMQVATVYVAKGTVLRMLQEEIRSLEAPATSFGTG